jgi:phosphoglycerate dehydrogenase-like enzyme
VGGDFVPTAIAPETGPVSLLTAVEAAGGRLVRPQSAEVLIWTRGAGTGLKELLATAPLVKWVQLSSAGVDWLFEEGIYSDRYVWTCAKGGQMGRNVAEVAMLMLLSAFRDFHVFVRAHEWLPEAGRPFAGSRVVVVGAGGVGQALVKRLGPFEVDVTVVRRRPQVVPGAGRVVGLDRFEEVLPQADAVVLALPLTSATKHLVNARRLALFRADAWLINVARGGLVDTEALVDALRRHELGGAGLDVVTPEPLPQAHPLWSFPNVIVTPHVANTRRMAPEAMTPLVAENLRRWRDGGPLLGVVDGDAEF